MADKKKEDEGMKEVREAAEGVKVIEEKAEKELGTKSTKPPVGTPKPKEKPAEPSQFMGTDPSEVKTAPPGSRAEQYAAWAAKQGWTRPTKEPAAGLGTAVVTPDLTVQEIIDAEKAKIRAGELTKQELIEKQREQELIEKQQSAAKK